MTVSAKDLARLLGNCSGVVMGGTQDDKVLFIVRCSPEHTLNMVATGEDDGLVQFRTVNMLTAPNRHYRAVLLRALVDMNYRYKMVKFAFDEDDGEVIAYIDLYVRDAELTAKQMQRIVGALQSVVYAGKLRCEKIEKSGQDPGDMGNEAAEAAVRGILDGKLGSRLADLLSAAADSDEDSPAPATGESVRRGQAKLIKRKRRGFDGLLEDD